MSDTATMVRVLTVYAPSVVVTLRAASLTNRAQTIGAPLAVMNRETVTRPIIRRNVYPALTGEKVKPGTLRSQKSRAMADAGFRPYTIWLHHEMTVVPITDDLEAKRPEIRDGEIDETVWKQIETLAIQRFLERGLATSLDAEWSDPTFVETVRKALRKY